MEFEKICPEPTNDEKRAFGKGMFKISVEQLGKVVSVLENKCPTALVYDFNGGFEVNIDNIAGVTFHELAEYVNGCVVHNVTKPKK